MATVEEIERHDREIRMAEAKAVHGLVAYLREAVIDLPVDSRLARAFVVRARTLEAATLQWDIPLHAGGELWMLERDLKDED